MMNRRLFLSITLIAALSTPAFASSPSEAYAKSRIRVNNNSLPSGVTTTLSQIIPNPYGPPAYYNYNESNSSGDSHVETRNKFQNSKALGNITIDIINGSGQRQVFNFEAPAEVQAHIAWGAEAKAIASLANASLPIEKTSTGTTFAGGFGWGTFVVAIDIDDDQTIEISGSNFIQTEMQSSPPVGGGG